MPDSKMVRDGKYPGLTLGSPMVDYVGLARAQGVEGEQVTKVKDLEVALRRGLERATKENQPYLLDRDVEQVRLVLLLEVALRRGLERATKENQPYLLDVSVAREGISADATWDQHRQL